MKKLVAIAAASAALAMPAMAMTMTISFAPADGDAVVVSLDDSTMKSTIEGVDGEFDYTWDEATRTLCSGTPDGEVCATFESAEPPAVGSSSAYTTNTGSSGTATITAMSE